MATGDPMDPDLLEFLDRHIRSVEQLEILLLLRSMAYRSWTAEGVSTELRSNEASAARRLDELARDGLLLVEQDTPRVYRYDPSSRLASSVRKLEECYSQYRLRIIERIFRKPDGLRDFAEAFRVSPPKERR